jgi:hypothetical protein
VPADPRAHDEAEEALVAAQLRDLDDAGLSSVEAAFHRYTREHPQRARLDRDQVVFALLMLHRERRRRREAQAGRESGAAR